MVNNFIDELYTPLEQKDFEKGQVPQYSLGAPTSTQTANQLAEANARLNAGVYGVDLALISPDIFEQVPKQHFEEIKRLLKLSDATATVHGPVVDLAGYIHEARRYEEDQRKQTERQVSYSVDRAHDLDPEGNTPINFHINTAMPGESWRKLSDEEIKELKKVSEEVSEIDREYLKEYIERGEIMENMGFINRDTGEVGMLKYEVKEYPGRKKVWTPKERLENQNVTQWDQDKLRIFDFQKAKAEVQERLAGLEAENVDLMYGEKAGVLSKEEKLQLEQVKKDAAMLNAHVHELDTHIATALNELHHKLQYVPKEDKKKAEELMSNIKNKYNIYQKEIEKSYDDLKKGIIKEEEFFAKYRHLEDLQYRDLQLGLEKVGPRREISPPELWIPTNELAKEKTVETVSNVAVEAYKKYGKNAPLITLENFHQDLTLGRAKNMKEVIEETRKKFVEKLVKEKKVSEKEAKDAADKLIGVTWDVGHINWMKKYGYSEEDIKKETEKVAPFVKQLHITDNFGFTDAHLPPGMGNAPIEEQIEILKKKGFEFKKGNVIVEAGQFAATFKESPHPYALEHFKSPLYPYKVPEPRYWPDIWETEATYYHGFGPILPDLHFREFYGAGFKTMPRELGGQMPEERGRFAGTPNQ